MRKGERRWRLGFLTFPVALVTSMVHYVGGFDDFTVVRAVRHLYVTSDRNSKMRTRAKPHESTIPLRVSSLCELGLRIPSRTPRTSAHHEIFREFGYFADNSSTKIIFARN